ncbi:MAG: BstYI, partial [Calditrichaeota bacterium]
YEVIITNAFKQIDFVKDKILVEVQFGKYPFMFYDLAKFQYFFNENKAEVGVEIVPCYALYKNMSTGVSYGEQLIFDIERLKRHFPAVPVKVILIDA